MFALHIGYSLDSLMDLFYRRCATTAECFLCAPAEFIRRYNSHLASLRHLPDVQQDGSNWPMRDLLAEPLRQRLLVYERVCDKRGHIRRFTVNLRQNFGGPGGHLFEVAPCLLTRSSMLRNMVRERMFIPEEHFVIQGIPLFAPGRAMHERFRRTKMHRPSKLY